MIYDLKAFFFQIKRENYFPEMILFLFLSYLTLYKLKWLLFLYIISFYLIFLSNFIKILYYYTRKDNIELKISDNIIHPEVSSFLLYLWKIINFRTLLIIYLLLTKDKKIKINLNLRFFIYVFNVIIGLPLWIIKYLTYLTESISKSYLSINWQKKKKSKWLYIFLWEIKIYFLSISCKNSFNDTLQKKDYIIILKGGNIYTNSKTNVCKGKIFQLFFFDNTKILMFKFEEIKQNNFQISHQIRSNSPKENNYLNLTSIETTKPSIKITEGKDALGWPSQKIGTIKNSNSNQYFNKSLVPNQTLKNTKNYKNEDYEERMKNAFNLFSSWKLLKNPETPLLLQEKNQKKITTFEEEKNNIGNETMKLFKEKLPELDFEITKFVNIFSQTNDIENSDLFREETLFSLQHSTEMEMRELLETYHDSIHNFQDYQNK